MTNFLPQNRVSIHNGYSDMKKYLIEGFSNDQEVAAQFLTVTALNSPNLGPSHIQPDSSQSHGLFRASGRGIS